MRNFRYPGYHPKKYTSEEKDRLALFADRAKAAARSRGIIQDEDAPEIQKAGVECEVCGISTFDHFHPKGSLPRDFVACDDLPPDREEKLFTHGQMDAYAMENVETDRQRIYGILIRIYNSDEEIDSDVLERVILGNRK